MHQIVIPISHNSVPFCCNCVSFPYNHIKLNIHEAKFSSRSSTEFSKCNSVLYSLQSRYKSLKQSKTLILGTCYRMWWNCTQDYCASLIKKFNCENFSWIQSNFRLYLTLRRLMKIIKRRMNLTFHLPSKERLWKDLFKSFLNLFKLWS